MCGTSEFNHSKTDAVHFLQIWILPGQKNIEPSYEQRSFDVEQRRNQLRLVVDPEGRSEALTIHADARLFAGVLDAGHSVEYEVTKGRHAWIQVARGSVEVDGTTLVRAMARRPATRGD